MFSTVSKKISAVFSHFDKGFKEMDEVFDQLDKEVDEKMVGPGVEHETNEEEKRPDGTVITRRTVVRRMK